MTPRQAEVLAAIRELAEVYHLPPTVREVAGHLGINPSAVHKHLRALRRDGHIDWDDGYQRTIRILDG